MNAVMSCHVIDEIVWLYNHRAEHRTTHPPSLPFSSTVPWQGRSSSIYPLPLRNELLYTAAMHTALRQRTMHGTLYPVWPHLEKSDSTLNRKVEWKHTAIEDTTINIYIVYCRGKVYNETEVENVLITWMQLLYSAPTVLYSCWLESNRTSSSPLSYVKDVFVTLNRTVRD